MSNRYFSTEDLTKLDSRYKTHLINSLTGFKSLNLIGTKAEDGTTNLALFSQVIHVGANPPLIGVLFRPHTVPRHTLENIKANEVFTVNHVKKEFFEQAHATSARWQISEFEAVGLEQEYLLDFYAPYVKEAKVKMGCRLQEILDVQANGTHFVVAEIEHIHLNSKFLQDDGFIDIEEAGTMTVSGLDSYHQTKKIARLPYAKPSKTT